MLPTLLLSVYTQYICFSVGFAGARPDPLSLGGLTQKIRHDGRSLQGLKGVRGREENLVRFRTKASAHGRRLLQLDLSEPLLRAAYDGELSSVRGELAAGADIEMREPETDATPLILAAAAGNTNVVSFLLQEGADIEAVDNAGLTSLHLAASFGKLGAVQVLADQGADLDATTFRGTTPLYLAAQNGHEDVVEVLLNEGGDIEAVDFEDQTTPLIMAAHNGHTDVVEVLVSGGADVNAKDGTTLTALHYAARISGGSRMISALVNAGANIDVQSKGGNTPLHFATYFGQKRNIETLLDAGADTTLRADSSSTAKEDICGCVDEFEDLNPEINELCRIHPCSDREDMLALFSD